MRSVRSEAWFVEAVLDLQRLRQQRMLLHSVGSPDPQTLLRTLQEDGDPWAEEDSSSAPTGMRFLEQLIPVYDEVKELDERGEVAPDQTLTELADLLETYLSAGGYYDQLLQQVKDRHPGQEIEKLPVLNQAQEFMFEEYGPLYDLVQEAVGHPQVEQLREWLGSMWKLAYEVSQHATEYRMKEWAREWGEWKSFWEPLSEKLAEAVGWDRDNVKP